MDRKSASRQSDAAGTDAVKMPSTVTELQSPALTQTRPSLPSPMSSQRATTTAIQLAKAIISPHVDGLDDDIDWSDNSDNSDDSDDDAEEMDEDDEPLSEDDEQTMNTRSDHQGGSAGQGHQGPVSTAWSQSTLTHLSKAAIAASATRPVPDRGASQSKTIAEQTSSVTARAKPTPTVETNESQKSSPLPQSKALAKPNESTTNKALSAPSPTTPKSASPRMKEVGPAQEQAISSKPKTTTSQTKGEAPPKTKSDPLAPTPAAPYGYKIVKVKKPDGTFAKVKRPLKEGEAPVTMPTKSDTITQKAIKDVSPSPIVNKVDEKPVQTTADADSSAAKPTTPAQRPALVEALSADVKVYSEKGMKSGSQITITEKELEQGAISPVIDPAHEAQLKHAQNVAKAVKISAWSIAVMFPLFFLALGITTAAMKGHKVPSFYFSAASLNSDNSDPLSQAITIAASAWPIVFAAVVAQSLKMYAAYKVERGVKLMTLEQLTSSHSVGGALKQPFMLRTFNWTTLLLIFIWALSPLAGQAILRMSTTSPDFDISDTDVSFFSAGTLLEDPNWSNYWSYQEDMTYQFQVEYSIVTALIQGYSQSVSSDQDIYRNLKIPLLGTRNITNDNYFDYASTSNYSSLLGYPFWIYNRTFYDASYKENVSFPDQSTNFTMSSGYFAFNCTSPTQLDAKSGMLPSRNLSFTADFGLAFSAANNTQYTYPTYTTVKPNNESTAYAGVNGTANYEVNQTIWQPGSTGVLYFASVGDTHYANNYSDDLIIDTVFYSECPYEYVQVSSFVSCQGIEQNSYCQVLQQTKLPDANSSIDTSLGYFFPRVLQNMTNTDWISPLQYFLNDTDYASKQSHQTAFDGHLPLLNITGAQLGERLGMVANALWDIGQFYAAFTGPDLQSWQNVTFPYNNVTGRGTEPEFYRYIVFWPWVICLIVCSTILTIGAIAAAIWETRTVGPDFLGFINTAVKKSVNMPKNMSTMNARERLAALQQCEVILHDAKPNAPVGKIALGVRQDGQQRLVKSRQYR